LLGEGCGNGVGDGQRGPAQGEQLLGLIGEIDKIFWETKQG